MHAAEGVLTTRGGMTSHAAVVARGMGIPCVVGAGTMRIDMRNERLIGIGITLQQGDVITIDGSAGQVLTRRGADDPAGIVGGFRPHHGLGRPLARA